MYVRHDETRHYRNKKNITNQINTYSVSIYMYVHCTLTFKFLHVNYTILVVYNDFPCTMSCRLEI